MHLTTRSLTLGGQLVVWAARLWAVGVHQGRHVGADLERGFKLAGLPHGVGMVDGMMRALLASRVAPIGLACVCCRVISPDERQMLAILAAFQLGLDELAETALAGWLQSPDISAAVPMAELAIMLRAADLAISHNGDGPALLPATLQVPHGAPPTLH